MIFARIRLAVAAVLFFGWLSWLALAVWHRGSVPIISRAQLIAASDVVVAQVSVGTDGLPLPTADVVEVRRGTIAPGRITVTNLPASRPPITGPFPGDGRYLLPLVALTNGSYRVAGLPRSPGYEAATPERPVIYPWTEAVQKQLRTLLP